MANHTLKEHLARYMDPEAFHPIPDALKFTNKTTATREADKRKRRRDAVLKKADAAIRFFMKPGNREMLDHRFNAIEEKTDG